MKALAMSFVAGLALLPLAHGPDGGLRPPAGDYRAPVPVPPAPGGKKKQETKKTETKKKVAAGR